VARDRRGKLGRSSGRERRKLGTERARLGSSRIGQCRSAGCPTAACDRTREVGITLPGLGDARWDARPQRGIKRGRLGSSRRSRGTRHGCPAAERDGTHASWDQSSRMAGQISRSSRVRTYKCVCGDLLKFTFGRLGSVLPRSVIGPLCMLSRGGSPVLLIQGFRRISAPRRSAATRQPPASAHGPAC
jgi:hypothetical protein